MKHSTYNCKTCGKETKWSHQKANIYCSNKCVAEGKLLESVERVKRGEVKERATIRKALTHIKGYECDKCNISEWNGNPITLQVDHINGDAGNNQLENLRLLCPNCHSQTKSFGGRNKGNGRAARGLPLK